MAKDKLLDWLEDASCNYYQCPYGMDIECDDCIKRMVADHDAEIRKQTIDEFAERLINRIIPRANDFDESIVKESNIYIGIKEVSEQMKGEKE